jgi:hypothetical protein
MNAYHWTEDVLHREIWEAQHERYAKQAALTALLERALWPAKDPEDFQLQTYWNLGCLCIAQITIWNADSDDAHVQALREKLQALAAETLGDWAQVEVYGDKP